MMKRTASAVWNGTLKEGKGTLTAPGGALKNTQYSFGSRFESGAGTNPEELIAAAHAACFAMALSLELAEGGNAPERLDTRADVTFEPGTGITRVQLAVRGRVPGLDEDAFREAAEAAKSGCPVSQALAGVPEITLDAALTG